MRRAMTVGTVTSKKTFNDAKAAAIINGFCVAQGMQDGLTNQQRLDWFLNRILESVRDVHRRNKIDADIEAARVAAEAAMENW
mgnify:CR=1 FL=1